MADGINPNIILGLDTKSFSPQVDLIGDVGKLQSLQANREQVQQRRIAAERADEEYQTKKVKQLAISDAFKNTDTSTEQGQQELIKKLQAVDPKTAIDYEKSVLDKDKNKFSIEELKTRTVKNLVYANEKQFDLLKKKSDYVGNAAASMQEMAKKGANPETLNQQWQTMKEDVQRSGLFTPEELKAMPQTYDPNFVAMHAAQAPIAKQLFQQAEQERHNKVTEGIHQQQVGLSERREARLEKKESAALGGGTAGGSNVTGEEAFTKMSPSDSRVVKAVIEGRQNLADLPPKERSRITSLAYQVDPTFDESSAKASGQALKPFLTGKQGDQIRSFNVAINHIGTVEKLADALNNKDMPAFNKLANTLSKETGGTAITNFESAKAAVSNEIFKALSGTAGGVQEREHAQQILDGAKTPAQLKGAIAQLKELMGGQLGGLKQQYKAATNRDDFDKRFLTEDARSVAAKKDEQPTKKEQPKSGNRPSLSSIFGD
jgi:hypothetical protein